MFATMTADEKQSTEKELQDDAEFDIVIVGAGPSAIGLVYGILTNPSLQSLRIAVIEQGENPAKSANGGSSVSSSSDANHARYWFQESHGPKNPFAAKSCKLYSTIPQIQLNNRILDVPVGIGVGGGTNLNACFCSQPDFKQDFKSWPGVWKNGDLIKTSIEELLRVMKKNGGITEWRVCPRYGELFHLHMNVLDDEAAEFSPGSNASYLPSFCLAADGKGDRISYYDSMLYPLLCESEFARNRVKFFTGVAANRIIIQSQVTKGVECVNMKKGAGNSQPFVIKAAREVILCAGAILSPALLIMSGIGDRKEIAEAGMSECHAHLPAVGKNLRDHILLPRAFLTLSQRHIRKSVNCCQAKYVLSIASAPDGGSDVSEKLMDRTSRDNRFEFMFTDGVISCTIIPHIISSIFRRGTLTRSYISVASTERNTLRDATAVILATLFNAACCIAFAVVKMFLFLMISYTPARFVIQHFTAVVNICLMNPRSTGNVTVRPRRKRSGGHPATLNDIEIVVNPGYLTNERDMNALRSGWSASDVLIERHFRSCIEVLPGILPMLEPFGKDWWSFYAREFTLSYYHWVGTCAMRTSENSSGEFVVNDKLQVAHVRNLRVCDASVFPSCISAPTALTCAGIGYAASEFLAENIATQKFPPH